MLLLVLQQKGKIVRNDVQSLSSCPPEFVPGYQNVIYHDARIPGPYRLSLTTAVARVRSSPKRRCLECTMNNSHAA